MKLPLKNFLKKYWPILAYFLISIIFLSPILIQKGVPFKYDWNWPIFNLNEFWTGMFSGSSYGILSSPSKYVQSFLGLPSLIGVSPSLGIKLFLILIQTFSGFWFFRFIFNRTGSKPLAFLAGVAYAYSPYIFIRTIVGFIYSLVAYAVFPLFIDLYFSDRKKSFWSWLLLGFLLTLIFSQLQAGALTILILVVGLFVPLQKKEFLASAKDFVFLLLTFAIVNLPWAIASYLLSTSSIPSTTEATTLNFVASLPHSLLRILMLSDHHITYKFFQYYSHIIFVPIGFGLIYLIAAISFRDQKNRKLIISLLISSLLILPFTIGPTGIFKSIYTFFFNHFSLLALFRETYHFEFLLSFALISLFAFGLNQLFIWLPKKARSSKWIKTLAPMLILLLIVQYFSFNFFGRFSLQQIPSEYSQARDYLNQNQICSNIYYPPSLGFIYFENDQTADAANTDLLAQAFGVPYITDAASVLNLSNDEMFVRNQLTSHFLDQNDNGEFVSLLKQNNVDCVVVRNDLRSNYYLDSKLNLETDDSIRSKWIENDDMFELAKSKVGLNLEKQFGDKIFVYKINNQSIVNYQNPNIQTLPQSNNKTILSLTSQADEFNYYKDGWIRGRYAFWRKEIFADLKQDFLYTVKDGAVLNTEVENSLSGDLIVRYLDGGTSGSFQLSISNLQFTIQKNIGVEKFVIKNLGRVDLKAGDKIKITNISGENAIADVAVVGK